MSTSHFMMELKAVSSMPAASMPTMDGVNSTSGHLKRSDPMVITCTPAAQTHAPAAGCEQWLHAELPQTALYTAVSGEEVCNKCLNGQDLPGGPDVGGQRNTSLYSQRRRAVVQASYLAVRQLVGLLDGGGGGGGGQLLFVVDGHVGQLLLDVAHNLTLRAGGEGVAALSEDLHQVVRQVAPGQVQAGDGVRQRITLIDGHCTVGVAPYSFVELGNSCLCQTHMRMPCSSGALRPAKARLLPQKVQRVRIRCLHSVQEM